MRRLAKQSREDAYRSRRDYQEIKKKNSLSLSPKNSTQSRIFFNCNPEQSNTPFVAFGAFIAPSAPVEIEICLQTNNFNRIAKFYLGDFWERVGIVAEDPHAEALRVSIQWNGNEVINLWGVNLGYVKLPEGDILKNATIKELEMTHLAPETFYFSHNSPIIADIDEESSTQFKLGDGIPIELKKCSYCGRLLPLSSERLGSLSFHKHNAKLTNHQNECRACKKWRINDSFNPLRTVDQLHESSVITRERKLFLREPEILQGIKDRTGAGLKSQIWERFGKKCFYCDRPLELCDVQLDHTRPLAYLWPIDEYATCLCAEHNNQKKEKFPADFYSPDQLQRLSEITGLSLAELTIRDINEKELERILVDLQRFASEWEARTFAATERKIREIRPEINLYEILKGQNIDVYNQLMKELEDRPLAVGEE